MTSIYELLSQAANVLDEAQNKLNGISTSDLNTRLYDLRCDLEDLRGDILKNILTF